MKTVSKAAKDLMIRQPFYGAFLLTLDKGFSDKLPTAGVSVKGLGFKLDINKDFWYNLPEIQRMGIMMHELLHLAFYHLFMRKDFSDYQLFNIAADLEVNQYISHDWLPDGAIIMSMFSDLNLNTRAGTKYYYEKLKQNLESDNPNQTLLNLYNNDSTGHGSWDDFEESLKDDSFAESKRSIVKSQLETQLKQTCESVDRGVIPGELAEMLKSLFKVVKPVFNWKAYFRRYMGQSFNIYTKKSYKSPSNRFEDSPGLKIRKKHNLLVVLDTSGSVGEEDFNDFFSEIHHIYKTGCSIEIIECDTQITNQYMYNGKRPDKITGRGGTIFKPAIEYYNKNRGKYTTMIYFTDGYGEYDVLKPLGSSLWVVASWGKRDDDYYPGHAIYIPSNKQQ